MRYKIKISYDGKNYHGFQKQSNRKTIQETLEKVFNKIFDVNIDIVASGRTDAGVSAIEQVCHFDMENSIKEKSVIGYINSLLPNDIRVLSIDNVTEDFHARYSSKKKTYQYLFYVGKEVIPVYDNISTHIGYNIKIEDMQRACEFFIGTHDFSAFSASNTSVKDKVRTIYEMRIDRIEDCLYKLVVTGNGFLYNMVRILMGTLVDVGRGRISVEQIKEIINSLDRSKAGKTIDSKGLYLKKVEY